MIPLKLDAILQYLRKKNYDANIQCETQQIYLIFQIEGKDFPVFIRIFEEQEMLQLLIFMPCTVVQKALGETARLLHLLNKELDLPGFGMDEVAGAIFYRLSIPFFNKEFKESLLDGFLESMKTLSTSLYPAIEQVATGTLSLEEVLKKVEARAHG